ncbi:MAG: hypothetical protein F6K53_20110 [Moorea sp. SIO4A1]|uniref:Gp49 family protein n=1 Tax=Moorena sp. SIO4A1 TaxID=2607835 RepID=UPI00141885C4|nr:Gp49 family protein [Moorena sp. SIO4A1]NEO43295.1 hypothetical protein [Moorena sp. SIO4A3]NEQ59576.1 hypothetical protein [Moorena sp. SIO4A1]
MDKITQEYIDKILDDSDVEYFEAFGKTVVAVYRLRKNGHVLVGVGACVTPANFDVEIGKKVAREDVSNQLWAREGYLLQERLKGE